MVLGDIPQPRRLQPQLLREGESHDCETTDLVTGLRVRGEAGLMSHSSPPTGVPLGFSAH